VTLPFISGSTEGKTILVSLKMMMVPLKYGGCKEYEPSLISTRLVSVVLLAVTATAVQMVAPVPEIMDTSTMKHLTWLLQRY
jgi:hypothetical protein